MLLFVRNEERVLVTLFSLSCLQAPERIEQQRASLRELVPPKGRPRLLATHPPAHRQKEGQRQPALTNDRE